MSKLLDITYSLDDIDSVSKQILDRVTSKTILFYGDMGVGKTTLIKSLVRSLGSDDEVSSPTFSIVNEYAIKGHSIYHFDCYRIEDEAEALNFGFEDYLDPSSWVFIEWPERIQNLLPSDSNSIKISFKNEAFRSLYISENRILTPNSVKEQYNY